ncbi:hypothetical protein Tco_0969388 [Tanacetum coccineum]
MKDKDFHKTLIYKIFFKDVKSIMGDCSIACILMQSMSKVGHWTQIARWQKTFKTEGQRFKDLRRNRRSLKDKDKGSRSMITKLEGNKPTKIDRDKDHKEVSTNSNLIDSHNGVSQ